MKCEFCGGEVGRKQRFCSYCGAENQAAVLYAQKLDMKKEKNQDIRNVLERKHGSVYVNKVMTFVLVGSIILFIFSLISLFFAEEETLKRIDYKKAEQFYAAGAYGKLQSYIDSCAYEYDRNEYTQISDVYRKYMNYHFRRNEYIEGMENRKEELEYVLTWLAEDVVTLLNPIKAFGDKEAFGDNQQIFLTYEEEVKDFLRAYFEFTEEELENLNLEKEEDIYVKKAEVAERLKRTYYKQKGEQQDE